MSRRSLRTFPARIAELGFDVELPDDWLSHPLPEEPVDFEQPTALVLLAVATPSHAAIVFSCAGRPAYGDGALHDWAHYLLQANGLQPRTVGSSVVAGVPAAIGEAAADAETDGPEWWRRARLLEQQDRCDEAERLIRTTLQHFGSDISVAELYRRRMQRLLASGDRDGARDAFARAEGAMDAHVACTAGSGAPLLLVDPPGVLVTASSTTGLGATLVVARIDMDGDVLWRIDTGIDRFQLDQIVPGAERTAFVGTRRPVPAEVPEPIPVFVHQASGTMRVHSLWQ